MYERDHMLVALKRVAEQFTVKTAKDTRRIQGEKYFLDRNTQIAVLEAIEEAELAQ